MELMNKNFIFTSHEYFVRHKSGPNGLIGVRNPDAIESIIANSDPELTIFGNRIYTDIYEAISHTIISILKNHAFVDGNKRTAFASMIYMLENNGFIIDKEAFNLLGGRLMIELASMEFSEAKQDLIEFVKTHTKKEENNG